MPAFAQELFALLGAFPEVLSFLAPIVAGEIGVIFVAFLAATGSFPIYIVFIWAALGMVAIDSFWFLFPRTSLYKRVVKHRYIDAHYQKIEQRLETLTKSKDLLILLLSKALVGTRILVIVFIGARKITYPRFLAICIVANVLWTAVLIFVGFLARGGFEQTLEFFKSLQLALAFLVVFFLILYFMMKLVSRWILNSK